MGAIDSVTDFITTTAWSDLPSAIQTKSVSCLLDSLGATLVGTRTRVARIADGFAREHLKGDGATLLRSGAKVASMGAAFANAVAANGADIDDCGIYTGGHPGAQVFPTALALAEELHRSARELLTATVIGYEVAFRAGRCMNDRNISAEPSGCRACGSWGSVATAAIAARLRGLSPAQTAQALGIAEYHSPDLPLMRDLDHPAMVKHGMGIGPLTGIMAAQLASAGFTGVPSILGFDEYASWVEDIGSTYLLPIGIQWKQYSCCGWNDPALYAAEHLLRTCSIPVEQIARIRIVCHRDAFRLGTRLPETTEEAQFNLAWPIACLLLHGEVRPEHVLEDNLTDPETCALARLVELEESPEFTRLLDLSDADDPAGAEYADVTIELADGRSYTSGPIEGSDYDDWPAEQVERKFRWVLKETLGEVPIDDLIAAVRGLPDVDDVSDFVCALPAPVGHDRVATNENPEVPPWKE
ncbi:MAG: MmgE/PrpD family protein [Actinomycetes bacterium]